METLAIYLGVAWTLYLPYQWYRCGRMKSFSEAFYSRGGALRWLFKSFLFASGLAMVIVGYEHWLLVVSGSALIGVPVFGDYRHPDEGIVHYVMAFLSAFPLIVSWNWWVVVLPVVMAVYAFKTNKNFYWAEVVAFMLSVISIYNL